MLWNHLLMSLTSRAHKEHQDLLLRSTSFIHGRSVAIGLQRIASHLSALGADGFEAQHGTGLRDGLLASSSKVLHRISNDVSICITFIRTSNRLL